MGGWQEPPERSGERRVPVTISNIRLVLPTDDNYKRWSRKNHFAFKPPRTPCPYAVAYQRALDQWEHGARSLLRASLPECPERILAYMETGKHGPAALHFRELDFVSGAPDAPVLFVEIKLRVSSASGIGGIGQVRKALAVARHVWPEVMGCCLNVHMAEMLQVEGAVNVPMTPMAMLADILRARAWAKDDVPITWIRSADLAALGRHHGWLTESAVTDLARLRKEAQKPLDTVPKVMGSANAGCLGDRWPA